VPLADLNHHNGINGSSDTALSVLLFETSDTSGDRGVFLGLSFSLATVRVSITRIVDGRWCSYITIDRYIRAYRLRKRKSLDSRHAVVAQRVAKISVATWRDYTHMIT